MAATEATLEELLAIDLATLVEHTRRAGDEIDAARHAEMLRRSLAASHVVGVRRGDHLVGYAMLSPQAGADWFVGAFNVLPAHRNGGVMRELLAGVSGHVRTQGIATLRSNVYKTNALSMAFHRRLGFRVTRESDKAVEYTATRDELAPLEKFAARGGARAGA